MASFLKDTFNDAVQTLFGHTPASPSRPTNDAAPHTHTRTPTESHRTSPATVDLTGSPPQKAREQSQARPPTKTRASDEEQRLFKGYYGNPTDGTPLPDPADWTHSSGKAKMGKPGAASSFKPRDTINRDANVGFGGLPPAKYGKHSASPRLHFLEDLHEVSSAKGYNESPAEREPAAKKRKLDRLDTIKTPPVRERGADHDVDVERIPYSAIRARHTPLAQPRPTSSHHSNASEREWKSPSIVGSAGLRSEFTSAEEFSRPNRKAPRTRPAAHQSPPRAPHNGGINGDFADPIVLEDEQPVSKFSGFQQGLRHVDSIDELQQSPETTSRHFPNGKAKMTHSTNPPRSEHSKLQRRNHQTPSLLRDRFQRTGPEEEVSDDELSYTLRKRSLSPAKRAKKAITAQEMPAQGYPLKFTRTETYESHGPELYITKGTNNSTFRVAAPLENGREDGFEFSFSQVVHALTDHVSRIRLVGPLISDGQRLHVDLQFLRITQLVRFEKEVARNITEKMLVGKPKEYMDTIFKKPLPGSRTKPLPPLRPHADDNDLPETTGPGLIDSLLASSASQRRAQPTANDVRVRNTGARHTDRPARSTRANPPTYAEDEVEDSSKPERYSEVHGLGAPWKHQLTYGSGRRRATVDFLDLERLDEGEFLNDQLIDFYLLYLFNLKPQLADKVYIFNTHFFSTLTRKVPGQKSAINYSAVARWTAKEDLFGYDYIVVPINQDVHWFVAIICNVSNISRKLAVEDSIDQATHDEPVDDMPASEQGSEQAKATDTAVRTSSPLLVFDSRPPTLVEEQDDEMLLNHREESELDLVNAHDTEPSPAAETARLKQLTLDESTPKGILPKVGSSPDSKRTKRKPPVKKWDSDQPTIIILDSLASGARSPAVRALKNYLLEEGREKRGMEAKIPQNAFYAKPSQIPTQANYYDCGIYLLGYMQQFFENPDEFKDRLLGGEMRTGDWPEMEIPNMRGLMRDILQGLYKHQESERKTSRTNKKAKPSESVPKATDATTKESLPAAKKEDVAVAAPLATKTATEPSPPESKIEPTDKKPPVAVSSSRLASPIKYSNPSPVMKQTDGYCSSPSRETQVMKVDNTPSPPGYAEKDQYAQQQKWLDRQDKAPAPSPLPTRRASPLVVIPSPEKRRLVDEQAKSSPSTVKARSPKKQRVVSPPKADVAKVASKKASSPAKLGSPLRTASPVSGSRGSSQNPISLDDTQETTVVAGLTPRTPRAQPIQTSSATVKIGTSSRKIRHRLENLFDGAADDTDSHVLETTEVSRAIANDDLSEIVSPSRMRQAVQQQYNDQPYNRAEDSAVPETPPAETRSPAAAGASLSQPISL